jgi:hypothetical protein
MLDLARIASLLMVTHVRLQIGTTYAEPKIDVGGP